MVIVALALGGLGDATHSVVSGDTVWKIAKKFGVSVDSIAAANSLKNPGIIRPGQQLVIPGGAPPASPGNAQPPPSVAQHTVTQGETLSSIAKKYGTSVKHLLGMNSIKSRNLIRVGDTVNVPSASPTIEQMLVASAQRLGVDPVLIKSLAWMESGWKQEVISSKGAIGVMQLLPETASFTSQRLLKEPIDPNKVEDNIKAGVRFYAFLLQNTGGDEKLALAGYFQGLRSVRTNGMSQRTKWYVESVIALKGRFGG